MRKIGKWFYERILCSLFIVSILVIALMMMFSLINRIENMGIIISLLISVLFWSGYFLEEPLNEKETKKMSWLLAQIMNRLLILLIYGMAVVWMLLYRDELLISFMGMFPYLILAIFVSIPFEKERIKELKS